MKHPLFILSILILFSCEEKQLNGIWIGKDIVTHSFDIIAVNDNQVDLKRLHSMHYWILNKEVSLTKLEKQFYANDSLQLEFVDSSGLLLKYYRDKLEVDSRKLIPLQTFNKSSEINNLKFKIQNKTLVMSYNHQIDTVDFIDSIYSYAPNENEKIDNYELFTIGSELFLITNTDFVLPIQVKSINDNLIKGLMYSYEEVFNVTIQIRNTPTLSSNFEGKWTTSNIEAKSKESSIEISKDSDFLIEHQLEKKDSVRFNALSSFGKILINDKSRKNRPFLIELKSISADSIEVFNYKWGNRKDKSIKYKRKVGGI